LSIDLKHKGYGWLRGAREALAKSSIDVARKAKLDKSTYARFERNELEGQITLAKLSELAEALDCELIYALRPKTRRRFAEVIWYKLLETALSHGWIQKVQDRQRPRALAKIASMHFNDPEIRRKNGWGKRKN
jgi:transcriptional regulator with XRE-family HTH domain